MKITIIALTLGLGLLPTLHARIQYNIAHKTRNRHIPQIFYAIRDNNLAEVMQLCNPTIVNSTATIHGTLYTPLSYAARFNKSIFIEKIVDCATDQTKFDALITAIKSRSNDAAILLCKICSRLLNISDHHGLTPLHHAIKENNAYLVKQCIAYGATIDEEIINLAYENNDPAIIDCITYMKKAPRKATAEEQLTWSLCAELVLVLKKCNPVYIYSPKEHFPFGFINVDLFESNIPLLLAQKTLRAGKRIQVGESTFIAPSNCTIAYIESYNHAEVVAFFARALCSSVGKNVMHVLYELKTVNPSLLTTISEHALRQDPTNTWAQQLSDFIRSHRQT